jgi:2-deoxy-D-gluconate 3-dehydrogenase
MADWGPFGLEGKRAIVTGGAMGIGFGIVRLLTEAGANVLIGDVDERGLGAIREKLIGPGKVATMRADVTQADTGDRLVDRCVEAFGGLDILVNNAGIFPIVPMLQTSPELFDRVYAVNLKGLAFVTKAAAARMVAQGHGGKIVNIASIDALRPSMVGLAAYDASKGGVLMLTKNLALEFAPHGIQVNAIAPGGVTTEGTVKLMAGMGFTPEQQEQMTKASVARIPLGRMGIPDDIAKVALFLASSGSDYMTGDIVVVDGGMLLT